MKNKCRFCGGKLIPYEQKRFWYGCSECRASGPLKSTKAEALAVMTGDGNENQLIETNCELNCRVIQLKENNLQLDKWNIKKDRRIERLTKELSNADDAIQILRTRNKTLSTRNKTFSTPKKEIWPEGVVAVDEEREAEPHEAGRYRYWNKTQNDNTPYFITMSVGNIFHPFLIYKKLSAEELLLREKPVKQ